MGYPILYEATEDGMVPLPRFHNEYAATFDPGKRYRLVEVEQRSIKSHNQYFAALHDAWQSLSEEATERFPTDEHLRKYALIKVGFCDSESIVLGNKADALRVAAFARRRDEMAVVTVSERVVTVFTAKSQSIPAMGKAEFQRSKEAVLDYVSAMAGVTSQELQHEAGQAA